MLQHAPFASRHRHMSTAVTFGVALTMSHVAPAQPSTASPPMDPSPKPPSGLVTLSLRDANLDEVIHTMSVLTGARFVIAANPKSFQANVVAPEKVTVLEAYHALLAILAANHLTVVPSGRFSKIIESADGAHEAPVVARSAVVPEEDRFVTYVHRLGHIRAEEVVSSVLAKMTSHDGQILTYGGVLILTDTGTSVRRMMRVLEELDVAGVDDKVWVEPLTYAVSGDVKKEIDELLDLKETRDKDPHREPAGAAGTSRITRIVALERPNAILIVGTETGYRRLLTLLKQVDVEQTSGGQMHVVMLEHAEAKKLVTALTDAVTAASSTTAGRDAKQQPLAIFDAPVKISAEETNNALIVTSSAHDFVAIRDVIRRLDQPRRQVYIEAVVMDLSVDNTTQVGAAMHGFADLSGSLGTGAGAFGGVNPMNSLSLPTDPTALQGLVFGVRGPSIPVPGFLQSVIGTSSIPGIGFLIDASTVAQDSDIVQSPSVMTTDNTPAEFHMQLNTSLQRNAASIALPSVPGAAGTTSALAGAAGYTPYSAPASQNYGKIGPMLQVTPHLNESDDVRLDIEETISDLTPDPPQGTLGTINFIERHAMTTMTVKDGSTAVVGGLVRNTVQHASTKVPVLGDIPILGFLFRSTSDVVSKANLVLVLTPHIIREEGDMKRVVSKRMEERQEFLDHYFLFKNDAGAPIDWNPTRGQGLVGEMRRFARKVLEERTLLEQASAHGVATHEPHAAIELPSSPTIEAPEKSVAAPTSAPRGVIHLE